MFNTGNRGGGRGYNTSVNPDPYGAAPIGADANRMASAIPVHGSTGMTQQTSNPYAGIPQNPIVSAPPAYPYQQDPYMYDEHYARQQHRPDQYPPPGPYDTQAYAGYPPLSQAEYDYYYPQGVPAPVAPYAQPKQPQQQRHTPQPQQQQSQRSYESPQQNPIQPPPRAQPTPSAASRQPTAHAQPSYSSTPQPQSQDGGAQTTLYVLNLPRHVHKEEIEDLFKVYGAVKRVNIVRTKDTDHFCGEVFVEYVSHESAVAAIEATNGMFWRGSPPALSVTMARPSSRSRTQTTPLRTNTPSSSSSFMPTTPAPPHTHMYPSSPIAPSPLDFHHVAAPPTVIYPPNPFTSIPTVIMPSPLGAPFAPRVMSPVGIPPFGDRRVVGAPPLGLVGSSTGVKRPLPKVDIDPRSNHVTLYVGGLPHSYTQAQILYMFKQFGDVVNVRMLSKEGRFSGVAFVDFKNAGAAARAIQALDWGTLENKTLSVRVADKQVKPLKPKQQGEIGKDKAEQTLDESGEPPLKKARIENGDTQAVSESTDDVASTNLDAENAQATDNIDKQNATVSATEDQKVREEYAEPTNEARKDMTKEMEVIEGVENAKGSNGEPEQEHTEIVEEPVVEYKEEKVEDEAKVEEEAI